MADWYLRRKACTFNGCYLNCQAIRGCGASPIQSESTKISEFIEYKEMLPYRGCKHPRRNQRVRPHNGWLK